MDKGGDSKGVRVREGEKSNEQKRSEGGGEKE